MEKRRSIIPFMLKGLLVRRDQGVRYLLVWAMSPGHWFQCILASARRRLESNRLKAGTRGKTLWWSSRQEPVGHLVKMQVLSRRSGARVYF